MNKTWKIVLSLTLAIIALIGAWALYQIYGPKIAVENVVPGNAVAYLRVANPSQHWQNLAESEFWKNASSIDIPKVLARNNMPAAQIAQVERFQKEMEAFLKNRLTKVLLGREVAVALYAPTPQDQAPQQLDYGMLWVMRLPFSVQAFKFVDEFLYQGEEDVVTSQEQYAGERVMHVHWKKQDMSLKYVLLKDLLIIGPETGKEVYAAIDAHRGKRESLQRDPNFLFVQSRAYPQADGLFYINTEVFDAFFQEEKGGSSALSQGGFKSVGLSFLSPGPLARYKFVVGLDESQVKDPAVQGIFKCTPKDNPSLGFIPADVIGYQWSGCYDFEMIWQRLKGAVKTMPKTKETKMIRGVEKRMGGAFETELLPLLSNEAGGYLSDVDTVGMFPYPRLLAFVKIKDTAKAPEVLKNMIQNPLGLIQEEEHNNILIRYMPLSFLGPNMDPAYCFLGDYLLAATSRQLLKKSIDAYSHPMRSLKSDKTFSVFGLEPVSESQSITFMKVGAVAHIAYALLDWRNKYLSSQVNAASAYKQESRQKKSELAQGLAAKKAELKLALKKLQELKAKPVDDLSVDDLTLLTGSIENLDQQAQELKEDIRTYVSRQDELEGLLASYEVQMDSAKLFMFNSQQVFVPILKGLETVNAQGLKIMVSGKVIETEFMFN